MTALPQRPWLRFDEVADYYGVTVRTIRNWIKRGLLRAVLIGGCKRIPRTSALSLEKNVEK
jgi:excisionase family DNA binding protein